MWRLVEIAHEMTTVRLAAAAFLLLSSVACTLQDGGEKPPGARPAPIPRPRYAGQQPRIEIPPADSVLPYQYCDRANQWVYFLPVPDGIQIYRTHPQESYREYLQDVAGGAAYPWARGIRRQGEPIYLVNVNPREDSIFDYRVTGPFDVCAELADLENVEIVPPP